MLWFINIYVSLFYYIYVTNNEVPKITLIVVEITDTMHWILSIRTELRQSGTQVT
jgi:hypothetical protein